MMRDTFRQGKRIAFVLIASLMAALIAWRCIDRGPISIRPLRSLEASGPVLSVAVDPVSHLVAAGTAGLNAVSAHKRETRGELTIWSEQDGKELYRCLENQWITSIAFIPNRDVVAYGKGYCRLATADNNAPYPSFGTRGEVVILRTTDFSEVRRISLDSAVYCLRASRGGKYLAVASARHDKEIFLKVYDAESLEMVLDAEVTAKGPYMTPNAIEYRPESNLSFSPNEQLIAVGVNSSAPAVLIYDLEQRKLVIRQPVNQKPSSQPAIGYVSADISIVEFEPTGRTLLVTTRPAVSRWNIDIESSTLTLQQMIAANASPLVLPIGNRGGVVHGPGRMGGSYGIKTVASFYVPEDRLVGRLEAPVNEYTLSFAISGDQKLAVAGDSDGQVHLWSLDRLQKMFQPSAEE